MIFKLISGAFFTSSKTVIALVDTDLQLMKKIDPKSDIHPPNFVTSSQDFHIEFVKSLIDMKKVKARIISKKEILRRIGRTGFVHSTQEPPIQNRRVGTYFTVPRYC